jgi:hypothetical protein
VGDAALASEIVIALPGAWPVDPAVRNAVKAAPGVLMVEDI